MAIGVQRGRTADPDGAPSVLQKGVEPARSAAQHPGCAVPEEIDLIVRPEKDLVLSRLEHKPDIAIREGRGRAVIGKAPVPINQGSGRAADEQLALGVPAESLHRFIDRTSTYFGIHPDKANAVEPDQPLRGADPKISVRTLQNLIDRFSRQAVLRGPGVVAVLVDLPAPVESERHAR